MKVIREAGGDGPDRGEGMAPAACAAGCRPRAGILGGRARFRPNVPNVARMYDYMLSGKDNYPADREAVRQIFAAAGEDVVRGGALQNRFFLGRAVQYLAGDLGIRQFLDVGTGLPTTDNVHEVAASAAPDSHVIYVDNDPVVIAHARHMLHGLPGTSIVDHDLRAPELIMSDPRVRSVLDFGEPIAVLLVAILHFVADADDPRAIAATLMAAVPPGSYLVISHLSADHYPSAGDGAAVYHGASSKMYIRTRSAVLKMFGGLPLLEPGLVWAPQWRPDADTPPLDSPGGASFWCGVARKPG